MTIGAATTSLPLLRLLLLLLPPPASTLAVDSGREGGGGSSSRSSRNSVREGCSRTGAAAQAVAQGLAAAKARRQRGQRQQGR